MTFIINPHENQAPKIKTFPILIQLFLITKSRAWAKLSSESVWFRRSKFPHPGTLWIKRLILLWPTKKVFYLIPFPFNVDNVDIFIARDYESLKKCLRCWKVWIKQLEQILEFRPCDCWNKIFLNISEYKNDFRYFLDIPINYKESNQI